jgi:hypothetical protein
MILSLGGIHAINLFGVSEVRCAQEIGKCDVANCTARADASTGNSPTSLSTVHQTRYGSWSCPEDWLEAEGELVLGHSTSDSN